MIYTYMYYTSIYTHYTEPKSYPLKTNKINVPTHTYTYTHTESKALQTDPLKTLDQ